MAQLTLTQMGYTATSSKECLDFVLDFDTMRASFVDLKPDARHTLVTSVKTSKASKRSWRLWKIGDEGVPWSPKMVHLGRAHRTPILKSNLQKAVRMRNNQEAVRTALEWLAIDRTALFRRLPIICVEDASLVEGTATIVWLMMAGERGPMMAKIAEFIWRYVDAMCDCETVYQSREIESKPSHLDMVGKGKGMDAASLKVRESFGGMKCDTTRLRNASVYYHRNPDRIYRLQDREYVLPDELDFDHIVLPEAIDYHPCPWILKKLAEKTELTQSEIKGIIWIGDSSANVRKPWTVDRQNAMRKDEDYVKVSYHLRMIRSGIEKSRYRC